MTRDDFIYFYSPSTGDDRLSHHGLVFVYGMVIKCILEQCTAESIYLHASGLWN